MDGIFCYDILALECEVVDSLTASNLADSNRHLTGSNRHLTYSNRYLTDSNRHLVDRSTVHTNGPTDRSSVAREENMAHRRTFSLFSLLVPPSPVLSCMPV